MVGKKIDTRYTIEHADKSLRKNKQTKAVTKGNDKEVAIHR